MERTKQRFPLTTYLKRGTLTQSKVSTLLDKPRSTISRWFNGVQEPKSFADRRRLCALLGISVDDVKWRSD